eukprot:793652_1
MASKCSLIRNLFQLRNINKSLPCNHNRYFSTQEQIQSQKGRQILMWKSLVGFNAYNVSQSNPDSELSYEGINDISMGTKSTLILSDTGNVYSCNNSTQDCIKMNNLSNIKSISSGLEHCAAIDINGQLYTWGYTKSGLGYEDTNNTKNINEPQLIEQKHFNDEKIKAVSCGCHYTVAITETGKLYSFGKSDSGQLGLCSNALKTKQNIPAEVNHFSDYNIVVKEVYATKDKTFALDSNGKMYKWG